MTTEFQWVIDNAESVAMDRLKTVAQSTEETALLGLWQGQANRGG